MIRLRTQRLLLRDHRSEDLPSHHLLLSDPVAMRYLPGLATASLEESWSNLLFSMVQARVSPRKYVFLRMEKTNGGFVGEIGYTVDAFTPEGKLAGAGYFLCPEHWGRGYAGEALAEVLRYAFEEDDVLRVSCGCLCENAASERVMQKAGLIREAVRRKFTWHEGELKDRVEYRMLREEWMARAARLGVDK